MQISARLSAMKFHDEIRLAPPVLNWAVSAARSPATGSTRRALATAALAVFCLVSGFFSAKPAAMANEITQAFLAHKTGSPIMIDHGVWNSLLGTYVKSAANSVNRIDYAAFKSKGHAALKRYITHLEAVDPATLDRAEQIAFWVNLYNAKTIDIVLDHYPVKSIREISLETSLIGLLKKSVGVGGPWQAQVVEVGGRMLSLDNIEHDILRPVYKDPRIHYAVNCASYGCPNLQASAFTGATLDRQLDEGARAFVNHPRGLRVDGGQVKASSIYDWFQSDFGGSAAGVLDHARRYANAKLKSALTGKTTIDSFDYDWRLNDIYSSAR